MQIQRQGEAKCLITLTYQFFSMSSCKKTASKSIKPRQI